MKEIVALSNKTITVERNEFLSRDGCIDTNIYYIEKGSVKIFILNENSEQIIRFGYKDNIVVSLDSFLSGNPTALFIQAIKKTTFKIITRQQIEHFLQDDANRILWISMLENLILQQHEREIDILTNAPKDRYLRVLKRSPQLFQEIPNKHIANYLRMSPETLSRMKKT